MAILEQVDIRTAPSNLNRESVLQEIVDISLIPLPFQSRIGTMSHTNAFFEWSADRLADPDITNVVIDGDDAGAADNDPAVRLGNHAQISEKRPGVSTRADTSNNIGNEGLARQIKKKTQELQRDMEAMLLLNNANVADTGVGGAAGETAGLEAWLDDETVNSVTKDTNCIITSASAGTIAGAGWTNRTGQIIPAMTYTTVTAAAASFADLKAMLNALWGLGADPTVIMSRPKVIEALSAFMFTSSAQIAAPVKDVGMKAAPTQAMGAVNSMVTDHGLVVDFVPNRLMQLSDAGNSDSSTLFAFDPAYLGVSYQGGGIKSKEMPEAGRRRSVMLTADYGLCVKNPDMLGAMLGIDETAAWTA